MKKYILIISIALATTLFIILPHETKEKIVKILPEKTKYLQTHPLVESAKKQIGVVAKYDTGYYAGGYPPEDRGACTDVITRALLDNNYNLKEKIDKDMKQNPERYPTEFDSNINFRRVRNVKIFLDHYAQKLPTCIDAPECFNEELWQPGDIVTYDQIPGSLWHIAIISNKATEKKSSTIPFLIHNYGRGTLENNMLLNWPSPITGHYRINEIL
ncbi:MAG: DUF1287 domain-containing protein [Candidatus Peregrinibacteria bacterium]|nr:DUF1287 domain-containing protein [Candidatus Peregrinibacteria bacterium]